MIVALLTALESATGPDRGLDAEIAKATGWEILQPTTHFRWKHPEGWRQSECPRFTENFHDALTLCGDAFEWLAKRHNDDRGTYWIAQVGTRHFNGKTPALACCIAAVHYWMETGGKVGASEERGRIYEAGDAIIPDSILKG